MVEANCPEGYCFVNGVVKGTNVIRMSCLIKNNITFKVIKLESSIPTVAVKVGSWKLHSVYREWSHGKDMSTNNKEGWEKRFSEFVDIWQHFTGNSLVLGDFNFDPLPVSAYQRQFQKLRDMVQCQIIDKGWTQLVDKPTRFKAKQRPSCLDHIYLNNNTSTIRTWNEGLIGEDHNLIGIKLKTDGKVFKSEIIRLRNIKDVTTEAFKEDWDKGYPHEIEEETEVDSALETLEFKIHRVMDNLFPEQVIRTKANHKQWFTKTHAKLCNDRDRLHNLAKLYNTPEAWAAATKFRNTVRNILKKAKIEWSMDHLVSADTDKKKWNRMKSMAGLEKKKGLEEMEIVLEDGTKVTEPEELAKTMNLFFREKVRKLQTNLKVDVDECLSYVDEYLDDNVKDRSKLGFRFRTVSVDVVKKTISSLKATGAVGRDGISTAVLKKYCDIIAPGVCHVVNLAITQGIYPSLWRMGYITPLPKAGDLSNPKNWRPVVINAAMSKVFERIIDKQMTEYMEKHGLYSRSQHAYRESRSCATCLIDIDTTVQEARNRGKNVCLLATDMSAAFNLISKDILVPLMAKYGFDTRSQALVDSYLTDRKTRCRIKDKLSDAITLDTGVGEGSVVGPNYFIMGMVSVAIIAKRVVAKLAEKGIEVEICTQEFADDTSACITAENDAVMQVAVDEMMAGFQHYFNSAGLCLNQAKCEIICFRSKRPTQTITLPSGETEVKTLKLLGLWWDSDYKFGTHISKVAQKVNFKLANMARVRPYLDDEDMKRYAVSLVLSVMTYCAELYLRLPQTQKRLQKLLSRTMRLVINAPLLTHIDDLLMITCWSNPANMYRYSVITAMRRMLKSGIPPVSMRHFREALSRPRAHYHLRGQDMPMAWPKLNCHGRSSFLVMAAISYNEINIFGRYFEESKNDKVFKNTVKALLHSYHGNRNVK